MNGERKGMALVIVSASIFGTTGTALAQVPGSVDPLSTGILRLLLGGGLLAVIARRRLPDLRPLLRTLLIGAIGVAVYQLGFFWAVTDTGVAAGTLVTIGVSPLASRVIGGLSGRPSPPASWYVAAAVLLGGLSILVLGGYDDVKVTAAGIVVAVIAGSSFALYTECGARVLATGASPDATMSALFFGAGLMSSPLLVWRGVEVMSTGRGLLVISHLSVVTLTVAYMAFGRGLRHLAPTIVTMLTIVEPVVATSLSVIVLDEDFSPVGWIGASIVVLGLPLVGLASRRSTATTVRP